MTDPVPPQPPSVPPRPTTPAATAAAPAAPASPASAPASALRLVPLGLAVVALGAGSGWLWSENARLGVERDRERVALAEDSTRLRDVLTVARGVSDSLKALLDGRAARDSASNTPFIVISIADNRLWYRRGREVLFETRVATGSGKYLEKQGATGEQWKFETPRGRLVVQRKDVEPAWVPPDWHFVEAAQKKKLELLRLQPGMTVPAPNGGIVTISGNNVVTRYPDGREVPFEVKDGQEIRVGNKLIVPPFGTNQRRYLGVLGANRLYLGDGYGIHGTDNPSSIGRSASHGCIRVRNEDIETLFRIVPVGTPVYVY
ncbi:MAG: L,D-transpeptidase [Gemmatimonadaceae bacterium]|nr:L,D-transpeptidase [Gemmatimonadaceae bacterium]